MAQYESMLARLKAISAMPEAQLATAEVRCKNNLWLSRKSARVQNALCHSGPYWVCRKQTCLFFGEPPRSRWSLHPSIYSSVFNKLCLHAQEDDRPASRNFRGLQVIRSAQVAHEAKGKAKIAAMQEFYSTCFLRIMTPIQARSTGRLTLPRISQKVGRALSQSVRWQ